MSATIDERVVEMRFDNKQFESNARESMGTIDKLKQALNFSASTKGFENLEKAASGLDMGGLGKAVEDVKMKFSALEVMAVTALANIANRAVNAGIQLVKSLSVDQISAGFGEYELKMGSIQTIMASTGESLETVNGYLDELNTYADRTIYSFSDMTQNIGKFTNAGVKLEDAVKAIQGVSNVAAVSGANANEASRAMYNFAQALSAGYVKLIDWKSIENANMATVAFKQALLDTAVAMGTVVKVGDDYQSTTTDAKGSVSEVFNATKMFNDSLSAQWMTTDVLVQTLNNYSTDVRDMTAAEKEAYEEKLRGIGYTDEQIQSIEELGQKAFDAAQDVKTFSQLMDTLKESVGSGWAQTAEIIIGDFEEAKALWTAVNNEIGGILQAQSDARNELLKNWKEAGGRDALLEGLANAWKALLAVIKPVKEAFNNIFPPATAGKLVEITEKFRDFTERLKISEETSDKLQRAFSGLFSIVDLVKQAVSAFFKVISPGASIVGKLSEKILDGAASIGDWITNINKFAKENDWFLKTFEKIRDGIQDAISKVKDFVDSIGAVEKIQEIVKKTSSKIREFIDLIKEWVNSHFKTPDLSFFTDFTDTIVKRFSPVKSIFEFLKTVFKTISDVIAKVAKAIAPALSAIGKAFASFGKKVADAFSSGGFNAVLDLFNSGVLAGIGFGIMDFIKSLSSAIKEGGGLLEGIKEIKDAVLDTFGAIQTQLKSKTLTNIATAIAILTGALVVLSLIDSDKLSTSLGTVATMLVELLGSVAAFEKIMKSSNMKAISKISSSLIVLSTAVLILAVAMKQISTIDSEKLLGSLGSISVLIGEMAGVSIALSKYGGKIKTGAVTLLGFAASILILAQGVKQLSELDVDELTKGLIAVGTIMGELAVFMVASKKFGNFNAGQATAILILSAALIVLQKAVDSFGNMDLGALVQGLIAVGAALLEFGLFAAASNKFSSNILSTSVAMVAMATAMILLQKPVEAFGSMDIEQLVKGLLAMGIALTELTVALKLMPKNSASIAAGVVEMAIALSLISKTMMSISNLSWDEIIKGLVGIGASLAEFAIALKLIPKDSSAAAASILIMSVALLALAPALKAIGNFNIGELATALIGLAGAFTIIGVAGKVLGPLTPSILSLSAAMALLGVGVLALSAGLAALSVGAVAAAGALGAVLGALVIGFVNAIGDSAVALGNAVKNIVLMLCDVIVSCVPALVDTVLVLIKEVLASLAENTPAIVKSLMDLIIGIIDALAASMPALIKSIVDLFMSVLEGVVQAFADIDLNVLIEGIAILSAFMLAMAGLAQIAPAALVGIAAMGVAVAELGAVLAAIGALSKIPGLTWLIGEGGNFLQVVGTAIGKFIGGIAGGFMTGVSAQFPQIGSDLSAFMTNVQPFISGAKSIDASVMNGVKSLAEVILLLTAANVLDGLTSWFTGGSDLSEFGAELAEFGPHFKRYYESVKGIDGDVVQASANAALVLAEMAKKLPNQGGVVGWFMGENSLADFADELVKFGPSLKRYSDSVKGLDSEVVKASSDAALVLAEMADKLPNQGGVVGWFMGENNLSDFADELAEFGPGIKRYADSVKGLDPEVVKASADAATALGKMSASLPDHGGMVSWFVGDSSLSVFGKELAEFGPYIAKYARDVAGIDGSVVEASANAATALAELESKLTKTGGMSSWFSGDNSIGNFGKNLEQFGRSFKAYYESISGINPGLLSGIVGEISNLVQIARDVSSFNTSAIKEFGDNLKKLGTSGIDAFVKAFTGSEAKVRDGIHTMVNYANSAISESKSKLSKSATSSGEEISTALSKGITGKKSDINNAVRDIGNLVINTLQSILTSNSISNIGQSTMTVLMNTINNNKGALSEVASGVGRTFLNSVQNAAPYNSFYNIGANAGVALANGIISQLGAITNAGSKAGNAAINGAKTALDIHSPSRVFTDIGNNSGLAFCGGLLSNIAAVASAGYDLADSAVDPVKTAMERISSIVDDTNVNFNPVITPVIDLSNVTNGVDEVSSLFQGLDLSMAADLAGAASYGFYHNRAYSVNKPDEDQQRMEGKLDQLLSETEEDRKSVYYNTFNIQSTDPKEAADEISYIMQHKVERGKAAWAKSPSIIDPQKKLVSK